uniref:DUF2062 domain-containing protein n=1 Tax=Trypanosoma vivax (strain Y486) TaxID=1055687 RepID=G0TXX9_TRYVY|nr:conserved hypothetical protein [Trypanosoma vivax Y486]
MSIKTQLQNTTAFYSSYFAPQCLPPSLSPSCFFCLERPYVRLYSRMVRDLCSCTATRLQHVLVHRVLNPCRTLSARQLLFSITVGMLGGIFPIPLFTSVVTTLMCRQLNLNVSQSLLAITVNLLVFPLEVLLITPFAQLTAHVTRANTTQLTMAAYYDSMSKGGVQFVQFSIKLFLHSCFCWLAFTLVVICLMRMMLDHGEVPKEYFLNEFP